MDEPKEPNKPDSLHEKAMEQFQRVQTTLKEEREQCKEDRRFCSIPGAQWEGDLSEQYENRPKFEVNKIQMSVNRIINDYRNNKIEGKYLPKGLHEEELSDLCNGLFRASQNEPEAQEAYDNSFDEAVQGGFGAFRLRNDYEDEYDEENDYQKIYIEPIFDADITVFFDLDAKRQDKADAKYAFVLSSMTPEAFEEKYGDEDQATWPNTFYTNHSFDWYSPKVIYVAEYYVVEDSYETMVYFETITGEEEKRWLRDIDDEEASRLAAIGTTETRRRKVKRPKVHKYIMSGNKILEDLGYIAGKCIPIVPVYGKRWYIENVERCMGHVRLAKDPQRLKNMQLSKLGEISSLSSVEKPILTPEQISNHQKMWAEDNIKDFPYLLINPQTNEEGQIVATGPIAYTKPSNVPPALAALLQITEEDMMDILGRDGDAEQLKTHMSAPVIDKIHGRIDARSHLYLSNFEKAVKRCGDIFLEMAKDIYVEDNREVKVVDSEGKMSSKRIRVEKVDPETGSIVITNNLDDAKFDMVTVVGPSSATQRDNAVNQTQGMLQYAQDPTEQQILMSFAMMNMNGEGMADFREYNRKKLVKMGVLPPTQQDIEEMQMQPNEPTPQEKLALGETERAQAEAAKYRADTVETIADAEYKKAQTAKIYYDMQQPQPQPESDRDLREAELEIKRETLLHNARRDAEDMSLRSRDMDIRERELEARKGE